MRPFWEISPFSWSKQHAHRFYYLFFKSIQSSCAQPPCWPQGRKTPPKLGIMYERYWLLHLAPTFEQHMELSPKTSNVNLTKNPTCFGYEVFVCYLAHMVAGTTLHQAHAFPST